VSEQTSGKIPESDIREIADAFSAATKRLPPDSQAKALLFGVNVRLNVAKAFEAAWTATKIWLKVQAAGATAGLSLIDGMELAGESFALVTATLKAIGETVPADVYVACVVLGSAPAGMSEKDFESNLRSFLDNPSSHSFPWYLGLTNKRLADAKQNLSAPNAFGSLMIFLRKNLWVDDVAGGMVKVRPRNFEWGLSSD
jgi:hypothetical protein